MYRLLSRVAFCLHVKRLEIANHRDECKIIDSNVKYVLIDNDTSYRFLGTFRLLPPALLTGAYFPDEVPLASDTSSEPSSSSLTSGVDDSDDLKMRW